MQKQPPSRRSTTRITSLFAVAFLSSTLTVVMAALMLVALNFGFMGGVGPVIHYLSGSAAMANVQNNEQGSRNSKNDLAAGLPEVRSKKSSLTATVAFKTPVFVPVEKPNDIVAQSGDADAGLEPTDATFNEPAIDVEQPANLPEGVPAMLRRGKNGNGIEIGNFHSATIGGDAEECVNLGYTMLSAARAKEDLLDVMVANKQITIAKICANNGTIVLSCRNGKISISPRRARPDDSCSRA